MDNDALEDMCQFITESFDSGCLDDCDSVMLNELEMFSWYCNGVSEGYCEMEEDSNDPNPSDDCYLYQGDPAGCDASPDCYWDNMMNWCSIGDGCWEYSDEVDCEGGQWSYCSATTATSPGECDDINAGLEDTAMEMCNWQATDPDNYLIGYCECSSNSQSPCIEAVNCNSLSESECISDPNCGWDDVTYMCFDNFIINN